MTQPAAAAAVLARGAVYHRAGLFEQAAVCCREVLALDPDNAEALNLLGLVLHHQGRPEQALEWFDRAIDVDPNRTAPHVNRGAALRDLHRPQEALASFDVALAIDPRHAGALANRAAVRLDLGDPERALDDATAALAIDPAEISARYNRASALKTLGRRDEALAAFSALQPALSGFAPLHRHLGELLRDAGRASQALLAFDRAIALERGDAGAWVGRGHVLMDLRRYDEAQASYRRALELNARMPWLLGHWVHARLLACDWAGLDDAFDAVSRGIDAGQPVCEPFVALFAPLTAAQRRRCAQVHVQHLPRPSQALPPPVPPPPDGRLRIGYFSADFREHPAARLLVGVLEHHDRRAFEVSAFSFGPRVDDAMRRRVRGAVERFVETDTQDDADIASLARRLGLHVAVDLGGATRSSRPGVFLQRAAPVQVAWLGFGGTSAMPGIDYAIADTVVLPPDRAQEEFTEAVAWLPDTYIPNDDRRASAPSGIDRHALGLPGDAFVYCCFNQANKIGPEVFATWMEVLHARPAGVLWLLDPGAAAAGRLREAAARQGVDPRRLILAPRVPAGEHLARHAAADLFLDTWPCNAHTTGSDALWAGLPVLTRLGESFAGRVGASLLRAAGLPELVENGIDAYRDRAIALSHDRAQLAGFRRHLAELRTRGALFDTARFTRHLESAFAGMWRRHAAGQPPASFAVDG